MQQPPAERAHFTLFGFPVRVSPFFLVLITVLGFPRDASAFDARFFTEIGLWLGIVTVSILWHELGHAFAMRRYGYSPSIELYGLGGRTMWGRGPGRPSAMQRVWVSLAGPGAGFLLGAPFFVLLTAGATGTFVVDQAIGLLAWVNVVWGMLNLLPMVPWDGGHVVEGLLDRVTGGRGRVPTAIITIVTASLAGVAAWLAFRQLFPILLCGMSILLAVRMLRHRPLAAAPLARPDGAPAASSNDDDPLAGLAHARAALERAGSPSQLVAAVLLHMRTGAWTMLADDIEANVLPRCASAEQRAMALELGAWARLLAGNVDAAIATVEKMRPTHDPSPVLDALLGLRADDLTRAAEAVAEVDEPAARRRLLAYVEAATGELDAAMETLDDDRDAGSLVDAALFRAGRFDAAAQLGERLFERFGVAEDAYNAACSHARADRERDALRWLGQALDAGYDDLAHLEADEDLERVRALPDYPALRARFD